MYLPDRLQQRSFVEWNYLVKGLIQVWELARLLALDQCLYQQLKSDHDAVLAERLGQIGNDCSTLARVLLTSWQAVGPDANPFVPCAADMPEATDRMSLQATVSMASAASDADAVIHCVPSLNGIAQDLS